MAFKDFVKTVRSEAGDAVEVTKLKAKISKEKSNIKDTYESVETVVESPKRYYRNSMTYAVMNEK